MSFTTFNISSIVLERETFVSPLVLPPRLMQIEQQINRRKDTFLINIYMQGMHRRKWNFFFCHLIIFLAFFLFIYF
jgi:hypothetical protein